MKRTSEIRTICAVLVELEFACLPGQVRLVALALYCLDPTQPAELPR